MWLAFVVVVALATQVLWECHRIRASITDMGMQLTRIRWMPFKPLFDGRWSRKRMYYRVEYTDRIGAPFCGVAVWTLFEGLSLQEQRPQPVGRHGSSQALGLRVPWLAATCSILGCLAIGVEYWAGAYDQTSLPNGPFTFGLLAVAVAAAVLHVVQPDRWLSTLPILALSPVATVIVRIAMDVSRDPTTHNLLPFEIVIAAFVGGCASLAGTAVGWLAGRWISPSTTGTSNPLGAARARSTSRPVR